MIPSSSAAPWGYPARRARNVNHLKGLRHMPQSCQDAHGVCSPPVQVTCIAQTIVGSTPTPAPSTHRYNAESSQPCTHNCMKIADSSSRQCAADGVVGFGGAELPVNVTGPVLCRIPTAWHSYEIARYPTDLSKTVSIRWSQSISLDYHALERVSIHIAGEVLGNGEKPT